MSNVGTAIGILAFLLVFNFLFASFTFTAMPEIIYPEPESQSGQQESKSFVTAVGNIMTFGLFGAITGALSDGTSVIGYFWSYIKFFFGTLFFSGNIGNFFVGIVFIVANVAGIYIVIDLVLP
jgi:hypothetical protein